MPNIPIYPASQIYPAFSVSNSLRFNQPDNPYLTRTISSAGSATTVSISFWFKRGKLADDLHVFSAKDSGVHASSIDEIKITSSDILRVENYNGSGYNYRKLTNRVFRDPSSWYHILVVYDTSNATADDRIRIYINGVRETSFSTSTNPSQNNSMYYFDTSDPFIIGTDARTLTGASNLDGYLSEIAVVDGTALNTTDVGEFDEDSGIWKPIDVSGLTFGTNGFYLDFEDSSALGNDVSGNDNDFTVNNLTSIDQTTDTCSNNYCTLNGVFVSQASSFSTSPLAEGNLVNTNNGSNTNYIAESNMPMSAGTWYAEFKVGADVSGGIAVGIRDADKTHTASAGTGTVTYKNNGKKQIDGTNSTYGATYTTGDIIGFLYNATSGTLTAYKNGTSQGTLYSSGSGKSWIFFVVRSNTSTNYSDQWNFGNPTFTIASSNTDPEGYGNFEYSTNNGYALNSKNLAEYG